MWEYKGTADVDIGDCVMVKQLKHEGLSCVQSTSQGEYIK
jgi:hypothetical protein